MTTAMTMMHLAECWIAERLITDPRRRQWAYRLEMTQRMDDKPRLGFDALLNAI
jgi:hypothetical protein